MKTKFTVEVVSPGGGCAEIEDYDNLKDAFERFSEYKLADLIRRGVIDDTFRDGDSVEVCLSCDIDLTNTVYDSPVLLAARSFDKHDLYNVR